MPFGAETMENDPCTVETTRNYNAGTGTGQWTHLKVKSTILPSLYALPIF